MADYAILLRDHISRWCSNVADSHIGLVAASKVRATPISFKRSSGKAESRSLAARGADRRLPAATPADRRCRPTADRDLELLVLCRELLVLRGTAPEARWRGPIV